ncbi:MAG: presenilin family intramembrane aspartyl protease PSH [Candidatus Syntropharchaeia archaeon]
MSLEKKSLVVMGIFILVIQLLAISLTPNFEAAGIKAYENPEDPSNSLIFIGFILVFTVFILLLMKFGKEWIIHGMILLTVVFTLYFVFLPFLPGVPSFCIAIGLTALLYMYPEWYVIDGVGILVGAGATTIFGISLGIIPIIILLVFLAIYDAISVYKTKHMITLAEGMMEMKIPVLFVIPKKRGFSLLKNGIKTGEKGDAYVMGLGDAIIPSLLVVSANFFIKESFFFGFINLHALGAMIGTFIGYFFLMFLVGKGKPHAGLPFLNTGAIAGFIIAEIIL